MLAGVVGTQRSSVVQGWPPLQTAPGAGVKTPWPAAQESTVRGWLSLQFSGGPPPRTPFEHVSLVVQALPSLQGVPSGPHGPAALYSQVSAKKLPLKLF